MAHSFPQTRLCPHCANSVPLDKSQCPYCKRNMEPPSALEHEWPSPDADPSPNRFRREGKQGRFQPLLIGAGVVAFLAVSALVIFALVDRPLPPAPGVIDNSKELAEKDQKIQTLEAELAKLRDDRQANSGQVDELTAKLDERERDLASVQKKLADANREIDRLWTSRGAASTASAPRSAEPVTPPPAAPARTSPSPPPPPSRPAAQPGVYETVRPTSVYEEPANGARVINQIARSTRVNVVRGDGDWLEVRSKHGNPPGFIRSDDAMFVARAN
jgi:TATA element modulatory factor 1-like protein